MRHATSRGRGTGARSGRRRRAAAPVNTPATSTTHAATTPYPCAGERKGYGTQPSVAPRTSTTASRRAGRRAPAAGAERRAQPVAREQEVDERGSGVSACSTMFAQGSGMPPAAFCGASSAQNTTPTTTDTWRCTSGRRPRRWSEPDPEQADGADDGDDGADDVPLHREEAEEVEHRDRPDRRQRRNDRSDDERRDGET